MALKSFSEKSKNQFTKKRMLQDICVYRTCISPKLRNCSYPLKRSKIPGRSGDIGVGCLPMEAVILGLSPGVTKKGFLLYQFPRRSPWPSDCISFYSLLSQHVSFSHLPLCASCSKFTNGLSLSLFSLHLSTKYQYQKYFYYRCNGNDPVSQILTK